jgi:hypothetical protein
MVKVVARAMAVAVMPVVALAMMTVAVAILGIIRLLVTS